MKNKPPTAKQVQKEVAKLGKMKPGVRHRSIFGEDHHAAIEGQIRVLRESLDEDGIEEVVEEDGLDDNVRDAMLEAWEWTEGNEDVSPSENWKGLVIN